ncbi:hypothetical protein BpHYR1_016720 [Brachionus plicatilis]|uniref:Uncharacterized protein n=1 Tax=Brachionus plicatilis TaxID=10195 RepID=A0A3M7QLG8_BRAPC|nr:hypothetical protein BpHYR1_016720 [Brachionus plicatilis]
MARIDIINAKIYLFASLELKKYLKSKTKETHFCQNREKQIENSEFITQKRIKHKPYGRE